MTGVLALFPYPRKCEMGESIMKHFLLRLVTVGCLVVPGWAQTKPIILIAGEGNLSVNSSGQGLAGAHGGVGWAAGTRQTAVNKHDQTMEMAQDFLQWCPAFEITVSQTVTPDYFVGLNREGVPTAFGELGKSQIMVLNARKTVIFVGKKGTVKNAVKMACNAIAADWQANGRIAVPPPAVAPTNSSLAPTSLVPQTAPVALADVAVILRTTAHADKYCKPDTIASVLNDATAYLASKGMTLGTATNSKVTVVLIMDRPVTKWIAITVQGQDPSGNVLWSEKVANNGWGQNFHMGGTEMLKVLDGVHQIIDVHIPDKNRTAQTH